MGDDLLGQTAHPSACHTAEPREPPLSPTRAGVGVAALPAKHRGTGKAPADQDSADSKRSA